MDVTASTTKSPALKQLHNEMNGWMAAAELRRMIEGPRRSARVNAAAASGGDGSPVSLVLGGDGFCGWPTALHLSEHGHRVVIVDNLLRRKIDEELGTQSLTPIATPEERVKAWKEVSGKEIEFINMDVASSLSEVMELMKKYKPDNIVHFAEIRAAPYSMKTPDNKAETVRNNILGVHNVLISMLEHAPDAHLIHLGTMGVYGYGTVDGAIPEGYVNVKMGEKEMEIVAPYHPGSVYHTTKCLDNVLFNFYVKNDQLKITDLHQGIVWGLDTPETERDPRLINRLDVDSDYGTVLNRFAVQSALGLDITPYGTGGQTRAFINIADTARCIRLATENPPNKGDRVSIFNQVAETHRVRDLASLCEKLSPAGSKVKAVPNPRNEKAENELEVINQNFRQFGWDPVLLDQGKAQELVDAIVKYKDRLVMKNLNPTSFWGKTQAENCQKVETVEAA
uniref:NAD-dependent epimerase/dehydratase domain-containing protein n=1 Tax=Lotharella globosa TaxID=91324 RepID=A0A7S4DXV1_9EUKA